MDGMVVSIPKVSIEQVKAARALLRWSQSDLAEASGVSLPTLKRLEAASGELGGRASTEEAILRAFELVGIEFVSDENNGIGVRLKCK